MSDLIYIYPLNFKERGVKRWQVSIGLDKAGRIFIAGAITGVDEMQVMALAGFEGAYVAFDHGHLYAEVGWLEKVCPSVKPSCDRAREVIAKEMAENQSVKDWMAP